MKMYVPLSKGKRNCPAKIISEAKDARLGIRCWENK
jgi:hypothetical protein